jgi:hypothetical protein
MTGPLEAPRSVDDLYLARAVDFDGVSILRPIMTGDVFEGVEIPGVESLEGDDKKFAIVASHPCSMREGPHLNDRVQVVRVVKAEPLKLEAWSKGYYDRMPLPDLTVIVDPDDVSADDPEADLAVRTVEGAHAALLDFRGRVDTSCLVLDRRIACMTEQGVAFLHQRMSHNDTRYAPDTDLLVSACSAVFAEIELWEEWNDALVDPAALPEPEKLQEELARIAEIFDSELSEKRSIPDKKNGWYTLRADLNVPKRCNAARRQIRRLLQDQLKSLPG